MVEGCAVVSVDCAEIVVDDFGAEVLGGTFTVIVELADDVRAEIVGLVKCFFEVAVELVDVLLGVFAVTTFVCVDADCDVDASPEDEIVAVLLV